MSVSHQPEIAKLRMPLAYELNVPPRPFFRHILCTVIGHVIPAIDRLNPVAAVSVRPLFPDLRPPHVLALHPQRMNMISISSWIFLDGIKIRHTPQLRPHKLLITTLRRPNRRFPLERQMGNYLPRGQGVDPITHFN